MEDEHPQTESTILIEDYESSIQAEFVLPTDLNTEDYARIIPLNNSAKRAFHKIASLRSTDSSWNAHHHKFLHVNEDHGARQSIGGTDEYLTGYYRLSMTVLPENLAYGWLIGSGRFQQKRFLNAGVDIRITEDGMRDDVKGRHARIFFHPVSRVPMLEALPKKTVILNGEEVCDEARVLSAMQMGLYIGNLAYRIEFLQIDNEKYRKQLAELFAEGKYWLGEHQESFDPTPSAHHFDLRGYQLQKPQAAGTFGVVAPCLKKSTGDLYAVKRIQRTHRSFRLVQDELAILERLGEHRNICSLVEALYSDGDKSSMGSTRVNDIYMILKPYAPHTFRQLIATGSNTDVRDEAFHQGAQGIAFIHDRGVIHRDIKPDNLLIESYRPVKVVVADFGHATTEKNSSDHFKGTVAYLAPEIVDLKRNGAGKERSRLRRWAPACDIFSYGVVGYEIYHGAFQRSSLIIDGRKCDIIDTKVFKSLIPILISQFSTKMDQLIASMISEDTEERPQMKQVLQSNCWPEDSARFTDNKKRPHTISNGSLSSHAT